jgi:hypothetical protein
MSVNPSPQEETLTKNSAFAELLNWPDSDPRGNATVPGGLY